MLTNNASENRSVANDGVLNAAMQVLASIRTATTVADAKKRKAQLAQMMMEASDSEQKDIHGLLGSADLLITELEHEIAEATIRIAEERFIMDRGTRELYDSMKKDGILTEQEAQEIDNIKDDEVFATQGVDKNGKPTGKVEYVTGAEVKRAKIIVKGHENYHLLNQQQKEQLHESTKNFKPNIESAKYDASPLETARRVAKLSTTTGVNSEQLNTNITDLRGAISGVSISAPAPTSPLPNAATAAAVSAIPDSNKPMAVFSKDETSDASKESALSVLLHDRATHRELEKPTSLPTNGMNIPGRYAEASTEQLKATLEQTALARKGFTSSKPVTTIPATTVTEPAVPATSSPLTGVTPSFAQVAATPLSNNAPAPSAANATPLTQPTDMDEDELGLMRLTRLSLNRSSKLDVAIVERSKNTSQDTQIASATPTSTENNDQPVAISNVASNDVLQIIAPVTPANAIAAASKPSAKSSPPVNADTTSPAITPVSGITPAMASALASASSKDGQGKDNADSRNSTAPLPSSLVASVSGMAGSRGPALG